MERLGSTLAAMKPCWIECVHLVETLETLACGEKFK